ncbi:MAG: hypothetical protein R6U95_01490 [Bacteroidales bacterium]
MNTMLQHRILIILGFFISVTAFSQRETTSPYSRYNYGDIYSNSLHSESAKGGAGIASVHPTYISFKNAAGHISIPKERFLFEAGAGTNYRELEQGEHNSATNSIGLEYIAFSFPILTSQIKWSSSIGLLPFSTVGSEIFAEDTENKYKYTGSGGINQAVWGSAIQPGENLTVGFHARYLFGKTHKNSIDFFEYPAYSTEKKQSIKTNGLIWDFGILYSYDIDEKSEVLFGATYRDKQTASYEQNDFFAPFYNIEDEPKTYQDTITNDITTDVQTDIPQKIGFGLGYNIHNKLQYNIDVEFTNWKNAYVYNNSPDTKNTFSFNTGIEYKPDYSGQSYFKRLPYRFGFHYTELPVNETIGQKSLQPIDIGISFGTNFILKQTGNSLTTTFIIGKRGDFSVEEAIKETYIQAKLTVRLQEHWFFKQKIN